MAETQTAATPEEQAAIDAKMKEFQTAGLEYVKDNPDYAENLTEAAKRGLDMSTDATREIVKAGARGVRLAHYLAKSENLDATTRLMNMKGRRAAEEIHRLLGWIDRIGFGVKYEPRVSETDKHLQQRRQDLRSGKRRR